MKDVIGGMKLRDHVETSEARGYQHGGDTKMTLTIKGYVRTLFEGFHFLDPGRAALKDDTRLQVDLIPFLIGEVTDTRPGCFAFAEVESPRALP